MTQKQFDQICSQFSSKTIMVVGDVMLDAYLWGNAERISPEAPVPLVHVEKTFESPGGAGNVALNIASLTAKPIIVSVIGDDHAGQRLLNKMTEHKIQTDQIVIDRDTVTTVKTRVIAHNQQVVRIDEELKNSMTSAVENQVIENIQNTLPKCDALILEDYNKGLFTASMIKKIIQLAKVEGVPVYVDPKKENFNEFSGVRFFKPNVSEFQTYFGKELTQDTLFVCGEVLRKEMQIELLMVTLGENGMQIFYEGDSLNIPTKARKVHDVSGAGDTVISTFSLADVCGASLHDAATLANYAAGRVVEEVGVIPITLPWLEEIIHHHTA